MMPGALVWWIRCAPAGYSMPARVPALVREIHGERATIWAATVRPSRWATLVRVKTENLRHREPAETWKGAF